MTALGSFGLVIKWCNWYYGGYSFFLLKIVFFSLQSKDEQYLEMLIDLEQQEHDHYYKTLLNEELEAKKAKVKNKEALINELVR